MDDIDGMRRDRTSVVLLAVFLVLIFMAGGDSRSDGPTQIVVRFVAIVFGAVAIVRARPGEFGRLYIPLGFALGAIGLVVAQLIPLPPRLWSALPGRHSYVDIRPLLGSVPWRPIALMPDLALNAGLALLPPLAAMLLTASISAVRQAQVVATLLVLILVSAIVGLLQASGAVSSLYAFRLKGFEGAVGLFANRNHQGALLALALPLSAAVSSTLLARNRAWRFRLTCAVALLVLPAALATGSRAALILGLLGAACAWLSGWRGSGRTSGSNNTDVRSRFWTWAAITPLLAIASIAAVSLGARTETFGRLYREDVSQEIRYRLFQPMLELGWSYFPVGTGYGSFAEVYKVRERMGDLSVSYLNQAHNDLLQLMIEGGLPAMLLALAGIGWSSWSAIAAWRPNSRAAAPFVRLGSILVAILVLASLGDYPLRTPTLSVVLALAACWMVPIRPSMSRP